MTDVHEFTDLDPTEFHLVPEGASGFPVLLAKAVEEAVEVEKGRLKAKERHSLPDSDFAIPEKREYPINDESHARAALSMLHNASPEEQKRIKAAVHRRYPDIDSDDAKKQTAPDKDLHESEAESQTREVDAGPEGPVPSPDNDDHGEPRSMSFPHGPKGDGGGDTAPSTDTHEGEAEGQTHDNIEGNPTMKAEGDGRGSVMEDKDVDHSEEESQTKDDVEGNAHKADADSSPGSPAWEHKDVALGEKAEHLVEELAAVVREFTEREKAEGGASKQQWRVIRRVRSLIENPTILEKEFSGMSASEALKALDEADEARRDMKKAEKKAEAKKAKKQAEKKAAKAADKAAKAASSEDRIDALQKELDALTAKRPTVNGLGVTAMLREGGVQAENVLKSIEERKAEAEARLEKATTDFERTTAKAEFEGAARAVAMAKMVAKEQAHERGVPRSHMGPGWTDLFNGTTHSLPADRAVKGWDG